MAEKVVVELTREQARAVMNATELLARLEIGQFKEITWKMIDRFMTDDGKKFDSTRRDAADELLEQACRAVFGVNQYNRPDVREKSMQHQRCWAVYSTIRYALTWHDHPEGGVTVDFQEPLGYGEKLPVCRIEEDGK